MTIHDDTILSSHFHTFIVDWAGRKLACGCGFVVVGDAVGRLIDQAIERDRVITALGDVLAKQALKSLGAAASSVFEASVIEQLAELGAKVDKIGAEHGVLDESVVQCEWCHCLTARVGATHYIADDVHLCPECAPATPLVTWETVTEKQIMALAVAHIRHFEGLLRLSETGGPGVNRRDVTTYLRTWEEVRAQKGVKSALGEREKNEVVDAIDSGDYDALLRDNAEPTPVAP